MVISPPQTLSDRRRRHRGVSITAAAAAVAGLLAAALGYATGILLVAAGLVGVSWALSRMDDDQVLDRLGDRTIGAVAIAVPVLPTTSPTPARDVAAMPAHVPAIVRMPDAGWGLVPRETAEAAVARVGFDGRWHRVAQPVQLVGPDTSISSLSRLPRDGEILLVGRPEEVPRAVTGLVLREASERPVDRQLVA